MTKRQGDCLPLERHGIRLTAVRQLVWREIQNVSETFCLADAERWLPSMDKSSIFRTLRLFTEAGLLHLIDDGTGQQKYCVCRCTDQHRHESHMHFTCTNCGRTYCLEDYAIPMVTLPKSFKMHEAEYIIKGICANCQ